MRFMRCLVKIFTVIALIAVISGCHHGKEKKLFEALPINTDGNPNGKIVLVEFLDYSDPTSAQMAPIVEEVMNQRKNVRVIYHPIVLDQAKAYYTKEILAASLQDRFLAAHHLLLNSFSSNMDAAQLAKTLSQAFVDANVLQQQAQGAEVAAMLAANQKLAGQWQVTVTPTFFVDTNTMDGKLVRLEGVQSLKQLLQAIDSEDKT